MKPIHGNNVTSNSLQYSLATGCKDQAKTDGDSKARMRPVDHRTAARDAAKSHSYVLVEEKNFSVVWNPS